MENQQFFLRLAACSGIACLFLTSAIHAAELTTLVSFDDTNGRLPYANLIADAAGNLYGTTELGGAYGGGTVFKLDPRTNMLTTLGSFDGTNGENSYGGLIADAMGNLYGTTANGGAYGRGTVFKLDHGTNTITALASFDGTNGANSYAGLIADTAGNLYGTAYNGGTNVLGTVFKLVAGTNTLSPLLTFTGNGGGPHASLIADGAGNLYGTTSEFGPGGHGTVFKVNVGTGALTTLVSFDGFNGDLPTSDLIADAMGNLYGTTSYGGAYNNGTIFKIAAGSNILTTLASFNITDGANPGAGVIADAAGNVYGTTSDGGAHGYGTVFRLDAATNELSTLVSFSGIDGSGPEASLIADATGNLYGTTETGGAYGENGMRIRGGYGTVFTINDAGFVVPEPSGLSLPMIICVALLLQRRRDRSREEITANSVLS